MDSMNNLRMFALMKHTRHGSKLIVNMHADVHDTDHKKGRVFPVKVKTKKTTFRKTRWSARHADAVEEDDEAADDEDDEETNDVNMADGYDKEEDEDEEEDEDDENDVNYQDGSSSDGSDISVATDDVEEHFTCVKDAFAAGWKAKSKTNEKRKARGFTDGKGKTTVDKKKKMKKKSRTVKFDPHALRGKKKAPGNKDKTIDQQKKDCICRACNTKGHWSGDPECPKVKSGEVPAYVKGKGKGNKKTHNSHFVMPIASPNWVADEEHVTHGKSVSSIGHVYTVEHIEHVSREELSSTGSGNHELSRALNTVRAFLDSDASSVHDYESSDESLRNLSVNNHDNVITDSGTDVEHEAHIDNVGHDMNQAQIEELNTLVTMMPALVLSTRSETVLLGTSPGSATQTATIPQVESVPSTAPSEHNSESESDNRGYSRDDNMGEPQRRYQHPHHEIGTYHTDGEGRDYIVVEDPNNEGAERTKRIYHDELVLDLERWLLMVIERPRNIARDVGKCIILTVMLQTEYVDSMFNFLDGKMRAQRAARAEGTRLIPVKLGRSQENVTMTKVVRKEGSAADLIRTTRGDMRLNVPWIEVSLTGWEPMFWNGQELNVNDVTQMAAYVASLKPEVEKLLGTEYRKCVLTRQYDLDVQNVSRWESERRERTRDQRAARQPRDGPDIDDRVLDYPRREMA